MNIGNKGIFQKLNISAMVFKQVKDNQLNFRAPAFLETITFSMLAITSIW